MATSLTHRRWATTPLELEVVGVFNIYPRFKSRAGDLAEPVGQLTRQFARVFINPQNPVDGIWDFDFGLYLPSPSVPPDQASTMATLAFESEGQSIMDEGKQYNYELKSDHTIGAAITDLNDETSAEIIDNVDQDTQAWLTLLVRRWVLLNPPRPPVKSLHVVSNLSDLPPAG